jgi:anti-sigma regulatory factor (Ser/Thr protein kinase)
LAGFDDRTASQLSAAVGELLSNIIEHSEASHTEACCLPGQRWVL